MAEETTTTAPTNFAEFEAAGGKYNPPAEPAPAAEETAVETHEEASAESDAETAKPAESANGAEKKAKPKPSLKDEHDRLLREVTALRKERRDLQQAAPAQTVQPAAQPAATPATPTPIGDKPPQRPRLSTFPGTLEEYEKAVDKYEDDTRVWQTAQAERERIKTAYGAKLADHLKAHPEYDAEIAQTPMSPLMVDIILNEGPSLGQALINDKSRAQRIQGLPRDVQIFEMGKLSAEIGITSNGHGARAAAPLVDDDSESEETKEPVKIPARLNATGATQSAIGKPDHGAKNFGQWEEIEKRLANAKRKR